MHRVEIPSSGTAAAVWALIAEPARWPGWAPHIRGARGLGDPEVEAGRRGEVLMLGGVALPVVVTGKDPGRSWTWQAGPVRFRHAVQAREEGCLISFELSAPRLLEPGLALGYGPVMWLVGRRLARVAAAPGKARRPTDAAPR